MKTENTMKSLKRQKAVEIACGCLEDKQATDRETALAICQSLYGIEISRIERKKFIRDGIIPTRIKKFMGL